MAIFVTTIERDLDFIVLPGYEEHHTDTVLLELLDFQLSCRGVLEDGCIITECAAIVELYGSDVYSVPVVVAEVQPQHFTLKERTPTVDSPLSMGSTIPDSDSTDLEFPIFTGSPMDAESEEDDTATSSPSDVPEDDDDKDDDDMDDSSMDTDPPAPLVAAAPWYEPMLLSDDSNEEEEEEEDDDGSISSSPPPNSRGAVAS